MDDLHWFQRFLHIFLFNIIVFGLFYVFFSNPKLHNNFTNDQAMAVRAAMR